MTHGPKFSHNTLNAGLLAARTASVTTGQSESNTGIKLEGLFKAGTARPIIEALATYAQDLENIECAYHTIRVHCMTCMCSQVLDSFVTSAKLNSSWKPTRKAARLGRFIAALQAGLNVVIMSRVAGLATTNCLTT